MKISMAFPIRFWAAVLAALLLYQFSTPARGDWCKYRKDIDQTLDLAAAEQLVIEAAAGDLEIVGVTGTSEAVIKGTVCASKSSWMDASSVETSTGKRARIGVSLPDAGWSIGVSYLSMDLVIEVPDSLELEVRDSSGDILIEKVASLTVEDSSGDIDIRGVTGDVTVDDSSGDMDIEDVGGDLLVDVDSSGDIYAENIDGSVIVRQDTSGLIRAAQVGKDVIVERDSSGDIRVSDVGGDFRVLRDGSGDIISTRVKGEVQVPRGS